MGDQLVALEALITAQEESLNHRKELLQQLKVAEESNRAERLAHSETVGSMTDRQKRAERDLAQARPSLEALQQESQEGAKRVVALTKELEELKATVKRRSDANTARIQADRAELQKMREETAKNQAEAEAARTEALRLEREAMKEGDESSFISQRLESLRTAETEWLESLLADSRRPVIGLEVRESRTSRKGVTHLKVAALSKGGPADRAGFLVGDAILAFGEAELKDKLDFAKALLGSPIGQQVELTVRRENTLPNGKIASSVEKIGLDIEGATPTMVTVDRLRTADDPLAFIKNARQQSSKAAAASSGRMGSPEPPVATTSEGSGAGGGSGPALGGAEKAGGSPPIILRQSPTPFLQGNFGGRWGAPSLNTSWPTSGW